MKLLAPYYLIFVSLFILVVPNVVCGQEVQPEEGQQREELSEYLTELRDLFISQPPDKIPEFIRRISKLGFIVIDIPEYWNNVHPEGALEAVQNVGEPFHPLMLDAIERSFSAHPDPERQLVASAWLYRYGRKLGTALLAEHLERTHDLRVAEAFALNQEREFLPIIFKALSRSKLSNPDAVLALGEWPDPAVEAGLLDLLKRDPEYQIVHVALAAIRSHKAVPLLQKLRQQRAEDPHSRVYTTAALISLGEDRDGAMLRELLDYVRREPKELDLRGGFTMAEADQVLLRPNVLRAFRDAKVVAATPFLMSMLEDFFAEPVGTMDTVPSAPVNATYTPERLAILAADALAAVQHLEAAPLVIKLLDHLQGHSLPGDARERLALAALALGATQKDLMPHMGRQWVPLRKMEQKKELKRLPDLLMPREALDREEFMLSGDDLK